MQLGTGDGHMIAKMSCMIGVVSLAMAVVMAGSASEQSIKSFNSTWRGIPVKQIQTGITTAIPSEKRLSYLANGKVKGRNVRARRLR
jgi:hypothetical protein